MTMITDKLAIIAASIITNTDIDSKAFNNGECKSLGPVVLLEAVASVLNWFNSEKGKCVEFIVTDIVVGY